LHAGGNKVLLAVRPVWTADVAMTVTQLQRKRAEFWDTAHSYEGHREIWDALKAACESDDVKLAQAIIDSANILLPTGTLTEAYDEQGRKYNVPLYCVAEPSNLINDDGSARTSPSVAAPSSSSSASASAAASLPEAVRAVVSPVRLLNKEKKIFFLAGETVNTAGQGQRNRPRSPPLHTQGSQGDHV